MTNLEVHLITTVSPKERDFLGVVSGRIAKTPEEALDNIRKGRFYGIDPPKEDEQIVVSSVWAAQLHSKMEKKSLFRTETHYFYIGDAYGYRRTFNGSRPQTEPGIRIGN